MWEIVFSFLISPIDPTRAHDVPFETAWHGRLMVATWGLLFPISILVTRFMKVMPRQPWPQELDNRFWFRTHVTAQLLGGVATAVAVWLIWSVDTPEDSFGWMNWFHHLCGWTVVALYLVQVFGGAVRGTRGGPDYPAPDGSWFGDHYNMTRRRVVFEYVHKILGYVSVCLGFVTMLLGLWIANAWGWMWASLISWWCLALFVYLACQRRGLALDTYQAIWGPQADLPGNCRKPIGIGISRRNALLPKE